MAFERRDSTGGAVDTTITADITSGSLSISIASSTGWPSGGASGPFFVIVDYDVAGKEKIEVASRTGTTLTVASAPKRGVDGTAASAHTAGAKIRHCFTRQDADEANYTMAQTVGKVTTKGDAIIATGANAFARLPVGTNNQVPIADSSQATGWRWGTLASTSLGTDSVGATQIAADAVGASELADNAVDTNAIANLAVTAAKIANGTITAGKIATDTITANEIAADAIGSSELANASIDVQGLFGTGIAPTIYAASDPGAVGAGRMWFRPSNECLFMRNAANTGWNLIGTFGDSISYTPTLTGVSIGTGGNPTNLARYHILGRRVIVNGVFSLGTTGSVSAAIAASLPMAAINRGPFASFVYYDHGAARASDVSANAAYGAVGVISEGTNGQDLNNVVAFATAGSVAWNATVPFVWAAGDIMSWFAEYERADSSAPAALIA